MKKSVLKEITICDCCGKEEWYCAKCTGCGKDICSACSQDLSVAVDYKHSVYCSGSGDGLYCTRCHERLLDERDARLMAYRTIKSLRREAEQFTKDFRARSEQAEALVKSFLED